MRFIIIFLLICQMVICDVVVLPSGQAIMKGERMEIECRMDNRSRLFQWQHVRSSNNQTRVVFAAAAVGRRNSGSSNFGTNNDGSLLYVNSTEAENAGTYICITTEDLNMSHHRSQLTVLESAPVCQIAFNSSKWNDTDTPTDDVHIHMQCEIRFRGPLSPVMKWRLHYMDDKMSTGTFITEDVRMIHMSNTGSVSVLTIDRRNIMNSAFFSCQIFFNLSSEHTGTTAKSSRNFNYTWCSPVIRAYSTSTVAPQVTPPYKPDGNSGLVFLVAALSGIIGLSAVAVIIHCIRSKRPVAGRMENSVEPNPPKNENIPRPSSNEYEAMPFACSDNYDCIEEIEDEDCDYKPPLPGRPNPENHPGIGLSGAELGSKECCLYECENTSYAKAISDSTRLSHCYTPLNDMAITEKGSVPPNLAKLYPEKSME